MFRDMARMYEWASPDAVGRLTFAQFEVYYNAPTPRRKVSMEQAIREHDRQRREIEQEQHNDRLLSCRN